MTPQELKARLEQKNIELLDVREPQEWQIANIGGVLIPLHELPNRFTELNSDQELAVLCHHGGRSAEAVSFLLKQGFKQVHNVQGGIDAWSITVDPAVVRY